MWWITTRWLQTAGSAIQYVADMKTMMEEPKKGSVDKLTLYGVFEAVRSPIAKNLWEAGKCKQPPPGLLQVPPKLEYIIEFP